MEKFEIKVDISVMYVPSNSFPTGVGAAFAQLETALGKGEERQLYGISNPDKKGEIIYRAAAEEAYAGEGTKKGLETFVIRKGTYISQYLTDWKKDESSVGKTFKDLLAYPGIDPKGYCLEIYEGDRHVRCLVPLTH